MSEAVAPVVFTVNVEVAPVADGDMEAGLSEQVGAREGAGETEHVRATDPANPLSDAQVMVAVVDCPADITAGSVVEGALIEKSCPRLTL
jgi:hypothetical protein